MGEVPAREVLWNIPNHVPVYFCFIAALAVAVFFFVRRWRLWKIGQPEDRASRPAERALGMLRDAIFQKKVVEKPVIGIPHVMMYASMVVLLIATASVAAQADLGLQLVHGDFYLYFLALAVDIAGLTFCAAMVVCLVRRAVNKSLDTKPGDIVVLVALLAIGVTGFVVEGLRIEGTDDPWRAFSPVGNVFSLLFAGWSQVQIESVHAALWWFHMALAFGIIAYWTYSKLVHVLLVPAAVWCRSLAPKGELPYIDMEDENLTSMGVGTLEDFTWKDLFDTQACIRCNRCQDVCPAYATGKPLSPKALMQDLSAELGKRGPIVWRVRRQARAEAKAGMCAAENVPPTVELIENAQLTDDERAIVDRRLVGDCIRPETLWSCTTCGACMEVCPAQLEHVPKIVKMRTYQVSMEGTFPSEAQATFRNLENNGNPWGLGWQTRAKWAERLDVPLLADNPDAEYLYWPGCSGAFDSRNRKVSAALVSLLREAGVDFAILGNEEKCCGDAARRLGNEFVYYLLASENIATLDAYGVKKIIVQCPHCYQALSRDYPQLGGHYEVIHHSELLARLIDEGRLRRCADAVSMGNVTGAADAENAADTEGVPNVESAVSVGSAPRVAFHDPCYLGRYRDVYDEPRRVVRAAGGSVVEMERHGRTSFCCGAGGGRMWLEETSGQRVNDERARQAASTNPDLVATACPFCLTMLTDGTSACDADVPVKDIAEILAGAGHGTAK